MKNKRLHALPRLTQKEKAKFLAVLMLALADFESGAQRMKEMYKISKEEWCKRNCEYYLNCVSAVKYIIEKHDLRSRRSRQ